MWEAPLRQFSSSGPSQVPSLVAGRPRCRRVPALQRCVRRPAQPGPSSSCGPEDKPQCAPASDPEQRFRRLSAQPGSSFRLDVGNWWAGDRGASHEIQPARPEPERDTVHGAEVPQVRVRNLTWRQAQQLAELTVLNERLAAGSRASSVIAVRKRIEWLRARRHVWERIYNYVTKQDAAATLAVIEDANSKAGVQRAGCLCDVAAHCSRRHLMAAAVRVLSRRWRRRSARRRASA